MPAFDNVGLLSKHRFHIMYDRVEALIEKLSNPYYQDFTDNVVTYAVLGFIATCIIVGIST
jgi:hypothetical protein